MTESRRSASIDGDAERPASRLSLSFIASIVDRSIERESEQEREREREREKERKRVYVIIS